VELQGNVLGHGVATSSQNRTVAYQVRDVTGTAYNALTLGREQDFWLAHYKMIERAWLEHRGVEFRAVERAMFAGLVLYQATENAKAGVCCAAVSQASDGGILGAMTYFQNDPIVGKWSIGLMAIDPIHMPGTPGTGQLRGIGTGLLASVAQKLLKGGATRIDLHPLDDAARRFWIGRGFKSCGGSLCVEGIAEMRRLIATCAVQPDCPADGDCVFCGKREAISAAIPRAYARL
jgi:hypothetical protein